MNDCRFHSDTGFCKQYVYSYFLQLQQRDGNNLPANLPSRSSGEIFELSSVLAVAPEGAEGRDPMIRGDSVATTDDYAATANCSK